MVGKQRHWLMVFTLLTAFFLSGRTASVLAASDPQQTFTLAPGGKATITFVAYCTEFGKIFPQQIKVPDGTLAADTIRAALSYIASTDISSDNARALEANSGIWQLAGVTNAPKGGSVTQDVIANAKTAPAAPQGATSVLDAVKAGQLKATLGSWAPIGPKVQILSATDNFYGRGTLMIENSSDKTLTLYMQTGTIFPGSEERFQKMGAYLESVSVSNPQLPNTSGQGTLPLALMAFVALVLVRLGRMLIARSRVAH